MKENVDVKMAMKITFYREQYYYILGERRNLNDISYVILIKCFENNDDYTLFLSTYQLTIKILVKLKVHYILKAYRKCATLI